MTYDVQTLFREVADLSAAERERYFHQRRIPADLQAEVESLLRFDTTSAEVLTIPIAAAAESFVHPDDVLHEARCGPYQLVRLLGQGGMGSVFLGQRTDGEVEQLVAIKLVSNVAQESAFRERFLRERQILASLSHPGIGRLLDAGHTSTGQPYFVMEYIDGIPIDQYANDLSLRQKIELILQVADAVSYAHRNLVIHRDIKPSNILVEAAGRPKLLDFGIARILDESSDLALTRDRILTPDYASPEQVRGAAQTTATDVYSLGAVLYRLLTGRSPHRSPDDRPESIEVLICTTDPVPPGRLDHSLPKDLDFIVGKALRKHPEERYASVDAFAEDLRALLEARPVRARSGNAWYRARKFFERHWLPVSAGAAAVICLSAGLLVADRERTIAQRRFAELRHLAGKMLTLDSRLRDLPGSLKAREEIVADSTEYLEGLSREVHNDKVLARDLADGYSRLARVQGVPPYPHLGQAAAAAASLGKADGFIESVLATMPADPDALLLAARIEVDRMILADSGNDAAEALKEAARSSDHLEKLVSGGRASTDQLQEAAIQFLNIGLANMNAHHYEDAIRYAQRAIDLARSVGNQQQTLAAALSLQANSYRYSGKLDAALAAITESRKIAESIHFISENSRIVTLYAILIREGWILGEDESIGLDRPADAVEPLESAFNMVEQQALKDPNDASSRDRVATSGRLLAGNLEHLDPARALDIYDRALARIREVHGNVKARRDEARLLAMSSYVLRRLERTQEAGERISAAVNLVRTTKDYPAEKILPGEQVFTILCAEADHASATGHVDRALAVYREVLDKVMATHPSPDTDLRNANDLSHVYLALAGLYRKNGDGQQADRVDAQRVAMWQAWDRKLHDNPFIQRRLSQASLR